MSSKGYAFESEIEDFFLSFTGQTKHDSILKTNETGLIIVNRSFRVPTSGAMDSMSGDIITAINWLPKQFKVECKSRSEHNKKDGQFITIEKEWIQKNDSEALIDHQIPILVFSFKGVRKGRKWFILRDSDYTFLTKNIVFKKKSWTDQLGYLFKIPTTPLPYSLSKKKDKMKVVYNSLVPSMNNIFVFTESDLFNGSYYLMSDIIFHQILNELNPCIE